VQDLFRFRAAPSRLRGRRYDVVAQVALK